MLTDHDDMEHLRMDDDDGVTDEESFRNIARTILGNAYYGPIFHPHDMCNVIDALRIDKENHGFCDRGTFACTLCLADGVTYSIPRQWLSLLRRHFSLVAEDHDMINLCEDHARDLTTAIYLIENIFSGLYVGIAAPAEFQEMVIQLWSIFPEGSTKAYYPATRQDQEAITGKSEVDEIEPADCDEQSWPLIGSNCLVTQARLKGVFK